MAMMSGVARATYDDVNLILRLYDMRREDRLRRKIPSAVLMLKFLARPERKEELTSPEGGRAGLSSRSLQADPSGFCLGWVTVH